MKKLLFIIKEYSGVCGLIISLCAIFMSWQAIKQNENKAFGKVYYHFNEMSRHIDRYSDMCSGDNLSRCDAYFKEFEVRGHQFEKSFERERSSVDLEQYEKIMEQKKMLRNVLFSQTELYRLRSVGQKNKGL